MHLLAASTLFLIVAGSLEGLVSPIPWWPVSLKVIVSLMTLVLMVAYLRGGVHAAKPTPIATGDEGLLGLPQHNLPPLAP
jgi:hypothetical protein